MNRDEIERLANAINRLRPDWPVDSLRTGITADLTHRAYRDAAVALTWIATDPDTKTPKRVTENGPWWAATQATSQRRHPELQLHKMCFACMGDRTSCEHAAPGKPAESLTEARARIRADHDQRARRSDGTATELSKPYLDPGLKARILADIGSAKSDGDHR